MKIDEFKLQDEILENSLFETDNLPAESIIKYLNELQDFMMKTHDISDYKCVYTLFQKWRTILLHFEGRLYHFNTKKSIEDFNSDISTKFIFLDSTSKKFIEFIKMNKIKFLPFNLEKRIDNDSFQDEENIFQFVDEKTLNFYMKSNWNKSFFCEKID